MTKWPRNILFWGFPFMGGHLVNMLTRWNAHSSQTQTWAYDEMQRVIQTVLYGSTTYGSEITTDIEYGYDAAGKLTGAYYDGGYKGMEYIYDEAGRLMLIKDAQSGHTVQSYGYMGNELIWTEQFLQFDAPGVGNESGLKMMQDYDYNSAGLLTEVIHRNTSNVTKEKYTATYDYRGYMVTEGINSYYDGTSTQNKTHNYDNIGQLVQTTEVSGIQATGATDATAISTVANYTYDKAGNRESMTQEGSTAVPGQPVENKNDTYAYTLDNFLRVTNVAKNTQTDYQTYTYDARGNQTQLVERTLAEGSTPAKTETTDYTYDLLNQLISTDKTTTGDDPDAWDPETVNRYNGDGQRVRQEVNGSPERYMYMGSALLYTDDGSNSGKVTQNILDPGGQIVASRREYSDGYVSTGVSNYYFYHYDMRGSVTNIVSAQKKTDGENVSATNPVEIKLVQGYTYDEFGDTAAKKSGSSFKNDVKFTGAVHDGATGLYYMNARHYDPQNGKFVQQDSYTGSQSDPRSHNLYTYCYNNPVSYIDPTGHMPQGTGGSGTLVGQYISYIGPGGRGPLLDYNNTSRGHDGMTSNQLKKEQQAKSAALAMGYLMSEINYVFVEDDSMVYYITENNDLMQYDIGSGERVLVTGAASMNKQKAELGSYAGDIYITYPWLRKFTKNVEKEEYVNESNTSAYVIQSYGSSIKHAVFYEDYIASADGIFDLKGKRLADLPSNPRSSPLIVGGNVYAYYSEPVDLPEVGRGWYRLDIEQLIEEY